MHIHVERRWPLAFVAGGLIMAIGGSQHPEADAEAPLREEIATMASADTWVLAHSLIALGTALLVAGLWMAHRRGSWPASTHRALRVCAIAMSLYAVETLFHLASAVDVDELRGGDLAPVAFAHIGLATVLYPASGLALAWLSAKLLVSVPRPAKVFAVLGLVGGLLHAVPVPLMLLLPDAELTPVFAGSGMLLAAWSIGTGVAGLFEASTQVGAGRRPVLTPTSLTTN